MRLLGPGDAAAVLANHLDKTWADRVCAEVTSERQAPFAVSLRPGVDGSSKVERLGLRAWNDWRMAWQATDLAGIDGAAVEQGSISVVKKPYIVPLRLSVEHLDGALHVIERLHGEDHAVDVQRARSIAARLFDVAAVLTPSNLRAVCSLDDLDVAVVVDAISWLREHPDLSGWTLRQIPVPGMHTKWLATHNAIIRSLNGRDLTAEVRPRLSVVHFTYTDPGYLATGARHHDAWTTGDTHELAYRPRNVLIVENRDSRLWFPTMPETVVVEGSGKAAAASLRGIPWVTGAERLIYWGDIDADGFAILDNLRAEMASLGQRVESMLMDERARARYAHLGVNHDTRGRTLRPSALRLLHLTPEESAGYASVGTAGAAAVRRIEQERIPLADAVAAMQRLVANPSHFD